MMNYTKGQGKFKDWVIEEVDFKPEYQGKCEAIFCQGNGYLGVRNATEESYPNQRRDFFIAGMFNKFDEAEVTELPNVADIMALEISIDDEIFSLSHGTFTNYSRELNLKTGIVTRSFVWTNRQGKTFKFYFERFISKENKHVLGNRFSIEAVNQAAHIKVKSGINGQMTNTGSQHFHEGEKRIYDNQFLQLVQTTTQSKIDFVVNTAHHVMVDDETITNPIKGIERRAIYVSYEAEIQVGQQFKGQKLSYVLTNRDLAYQDVQTLHELQQEGLAAIRMIVEKGYQNLCEQSMQSWQEYWDKHDIIIDSVNSTDQLAIRFAQYHLAVMTPIHDARMGIAAKGLSGEGYKGHSFWDTEIFIFPYWMYTEPEVAEKLLAYRYNTIGGAYKKAQDNGYEGAMYPWESAWADDGEVTPVWGAVDIVTGKATKILSGFIEIHITADIIVALWQYFTATNDLSFMDKYGFEMIFQTAKFWASRFEWKADKQRYEIHDVIGSDEYKEHVNNNALTNYMAYHNMKIAEKCYEMLKTTNPQKFAELDERFGISQIIAKIREMEPKLYLPKPRQTDGLIPQDDTYLTLEEIDLKPYKEQQNVGSIFQKYNLEQVNQIQVSKQADVVMLLYLLEDMFDAETKWKNFQYYEARTLHDSSLSLSTHSILGNDLGRHDLAYNLFLKATEIDLGPNMKTSDDGIHAAAMGGIWQCCVNGFGGVRVIGDDLRIVPKLPTQWNKLTYRIHWQNQLLAITVTQGEMMIKNTGKQAVTVLTRKGNITIHAGEEYAEKITG